ncbi:MAG: aminotransferase class I/II-fold pyridoxal phosphate-dependent enzyme [Comamonadaceae bacterium]|nr:MAG: aminotransferase class I/II-fold pyridoxal phosphate-dependent enzyme [Comamonadaceae bacterium]
MPIARPAHGGPDGLGVPLHDFSSNSNAAGPCPAALLAVQHADATRYPDPGYTDVRARLAAFHGVAPGRIVLAGSASEFIFRITASVARAGAHTVRLPEYSFGDCASAAQAWGLGAARDGEAPALRWCCDPSSPLGQPQQDLAAAVNALDAGTTCVLDLAYEPLRLQGGLGLDAARRERVWQLWTPNKALGLTGIRAAYAVAPVGAQAQVDFVESLAPSWPIGAHGVALLQSWTTAETQRWLAASLDTLRAWKSRLIALCDALGWRCSESVANFFCVRPGDHDVAALCTALRAQGIKLRDTASFGLAGHVRLAALPPASQDALRIAVAGVR